VHGRLDNNLRINMRRKTIHRRPLLYTISTQRHSLYGLCNVGSRALSFSDPYCQSTCLSVGLSFCPSVCLSTVFQNVSSPAVLVGISGYFNTMFYSGAYIPRGTGGTRPPSVERGTVIRHVPPNMAHICLSFSWPVLI